MYCPNCGAESTFGLNYCKRCGSNLTDATQTPPVSPARNIWAALVLAAATTGIVLGGFGIIFSQTLGLIGPQPPGYSPPVHDAVAVAGMMVLFGSAAIVLVSLMLIKLFSRMMGFSSNEKPSRSSKAFTPAQRFPQIQAPPVSMDSVTEHTTRNFEPRVRRRDTGE